MNGTNVDCWEVALAKDAGWTTREEPTAHCVLR